MACPKINGWEVFNDFDICAVSERMNEPDGFLGDYEALQHIPDCPDCSAKLGAAVARDMLESDSFGWWTVDPRIHTSGHVMPYMLRVNANGELVDDDEEG